MNVGDKDKNSGLKTEGRVADSEWNALTRYR